MAASSYPAKYLGRQLGRHIILILISLAFLVPFVVMAFTALQPESAVFSSGGASLIPRQWTLENFGQAVRAMPFLRYFANTALLVALNVGGTLLSCPLVAYALAKLRFPGRGAAFGLVLATMMLPQQVIFLPMYLIWNAVGAVGTYWPLIIPQFLGTPFYIFLLRQFFMGVPDSLREAAKIDGASELRIYLRIILPLAKPALATVAVFQFVATWTDFLLPLIYLTDSSQYTLSIGLYNFFGQNIVQWGPLMAACLLFSVPVVGIFVLAQRYFVQGISVTGFK